MEFFENSLGIVNNFLHFQSQLITKSYLNMEVIDLFVKILVFVKILFKSKKEEIILDP